MRSSCEADNQEFQAQFPRHKRDEEKTPNRPDAFYSCVNSEGQKIRWMVKEYFAQNFPDAH